MAEFLVVAGLSGAGRSQAAMILEDLGWFIVDNLPASLVSTIGELANVPGSTISRLALIVGRSGNASEALPAIAGLRAAGHQVRILFLEAPTDVLVRRYGSTRRPHPLAEADGSGLTEAIERERAALEDVKAEADVVIDTGDLTIHQLRARLTPLFGSEATPPGMQITITTFGYKHGLPLDVDMVFDCRFLPNPYWVDELRAQNGLDPAVRDFVLSQPGAVEFLDKVEALLEQLLPAYLAEGKAYLALAFGCTGGQHRSVALAEEIARRLRRAGRAPVVNHRDIDR